MWLILTILLFFLGCVDEAAPDEIETLQPPTKQQLCPPGEPLCINANTGERSVCGIPLIIKRVKDAPFVSARAYFSRDYNSDYPTESIALQILETMNRWSGTESLPSPSYDRFLAENGADIWTLVNDDYVVTSLEVPSHLLESVWEVFTDKILFSNLLSYDFEHAVRTLEYSMSNILDDPKIAASFLGYQLFAKRTYDIDSDIDKDIEIVHRMDFDIVQDIWEELHERRRMTVVISGDVNDDEIEELISDSFCSIPKGEKPTFEVTDKPTEKVPLVTSEIYPDAPTYCVYGYFSAPDPSHEDYPAFSLAISILNDKLYNSVRFEAGLAYSTGAQSGFSKRNYAYIWFYSKEPLLSIELARQAIEEMRYGTISEYELTSAYNTFVTKVYSASQDGNGQTWQIGLWEVVGGDRMLADNIIQQKKESAADDISEVSKTWFGPFSFGVTGPEDISQTITDAFKSE